MCKLRLICVLLCAVLAASLLSAAPYAVDGSCVTAGKLRVTVLSPTLIRIEASGAQRFVDEPSVLVRDRAWPKPAFTAAQHGDRLQVRTAALELDCDPGQAPPTAESLKVTWRAGGRTGVWQPGQKDQGNLGGTRGALDGIKAGNLPPLDSGLLSREGWMLLDDSRRPLWLGEERWLQPRPQGSGTDWYFFAYGDDYPAMLRQYVRLCGRIPMLPRYAWGTWFSRYWDYSAAELQDVVRGFSALDIPLDVLVIDVDWHKYGWEGYDWNSKQFPDPEGLLRWLHERGLRVTLNNHPGSPLPVEDSHHGPAIAMAGVTSDEAKQPLAWDLANPRHNRAFVEAVHWPLERLGVDFWWIDGNPPARAEGLDGALWCAKTYYDGTGRRSGERSLTFSRYGGLGQHRYPAGFSGDVYSQWEVLNYEIRYTSRAGNVAFPYWSHDIGGFMGDRLDPELYVRWCQFGALSPILRLHSNHGVREPWSYGPEAQRIVRDYFVLRQQLYPYLNTCQREVYESGMPLCRALYMHWPRLPEAYRFDSEYLLGPDLLVAPVTQHSGSDGLATTEVWLPPGLWWDYWTGAALQGPRTLLYRARLDRCPLFVRAGAVIPTQPPMRHLGERPADPLTVRVWPGASGASELYEDDGISLGYARGEAAVTPLRVRCDSGSVGLSIGAARGSYGGALQARGWLVEVNGISAPAAVRVDGRAVQSYTYDIAARRVTVRVPRGSVLRSHEISVSAAASAEAAAAQALAGAYRAGADAAICALAAGATGPQPVTTPERSALATLANAATAGRPPAELAALLQKAWQALATAGLPPATQSAAMRALVGAEATAELTPGLGSEERRLTAQLATTVPLPGAEVKTEPVLPEGWQQVGAVQAAARADGGPYASSTGACSLAVRPAPASATPPLGLLEYGADFSLRWLGQDLAVPARAGLDCSFVQQWHLIGPFPNENGKGLDAVFPPEQRIDFGASYPGLEGEAKWQTTGWQLPSSGDPAVFINLEPRFKPNQSAVAYGVATILAESEMPAVLSLGSDDSCKVWLNGKPVHEFREPRPPAPGVDKVPVTLKAGTNNVLFKVVNYGGQWGLYLQVVDAEGRPLKGLRTRL